MDRHPRLKTAAATLALISLVLASGCQGGRAKGPTSGKIVVISEPSTGGEVSIDGKPTGRKSNVVIAGVKPGAHLIDVTKPNPDSTALPEVGQAEVNVQAGKTKRVIVRLGFMSIVPVAGKLSTVAETESEKSILEYARALSDSDYRTAYSYLSRALRSEYAPSYTAFVRAAARLKEVKVLGMRKRQAEPAASTETDEVQIRITRTLSASGEPLVERLTLLVTTISDYSGLRKLHAVATPGGKRVSPTFSSPG